MILVSQLNKFGLLNVSPLVTLPIPSRSRSAGNGSRSTGRQVEFMDDLSDGEQR
jgi:hypothetical protein